MAGSLAAGAGEAHREPDWGALERKLDVRFKERALLRQAVVHRSFLHEHPELDWESYDRLEYLGDAFLDWVVADELFARRAEYAEGDLTRARAALVRGETLAKVASSIGLGDYLYLGQGEEASGGRARRSNLAATLEAVLAAVLLDRGARTARRLVLRWLGTRMDALDASGAPRDAKSALQELAQHRGLPLPIYLMLEQRGPSHARHFRVSVSVDDELMGEGSGGRKVEAEQAAAAMALRHLREA